MHARALGFLYLEHIVLLVHVRKEYSVRYCICRDCIALPFGDLSLKQTAPIAAPILRPYIFWCCDQDPCLSLDLEVVVPWH